MVPEEGYQAPWSGGVSCQSMELGDRGLGGLGEPLQCRGLSSLWRRGSRHSFPQGGKGVILEQGLPSKMLLHPQPTQCSPASRASWEWL